MQFEEDRWANLRLKKHLKLIFADLVEKQLSTFFCHILFNGKN